MIDPRRWAAEHAKTIEEFAAYSQSACAGIVPLDRTRAAAFEEALLEIFDDTVDPALERKVWSALPGGDTKVLSAVWALLPDGGPWHPRVIVTVGSKEYDEPRTGSVRLEFTVDLPARGTLEQPYRSMAITNPELAWPIKPVLSAAFPSGDYVHPERLELNETSSSHWTYRAGVQLWKSDVEGLRRDPAGWAHDFADALGKSREGIATLRSSDALARAIRDMRGVGAHPTVEAAAASPTTTLREDLGELQAHLREALCVVLQGPPGTGKTHRALELVRAMSGGNPFRCQLAQLADAEADAAPIVWDIVQLHPGYAYEDLVRGLVTDDSQSGIRFKSRDRIVCKMAKLASRRGDRPTILILDEINRCNLAVVLGELILLLEPSRRNVAVRLQYDDPDEPGAPFSLPPNLWIIGTMNTADRSIALVDYAIRRRFRFLDVLPDPRVLDSDSADARQASAAKQLMTAVNDIVREPRLRIGHAYFMVGKEPGWEGRLARRVAFEVIPLLREYRAESLLGSDEVSVFDVRISLAAPSDDTLTGKLEGAINQLRGSDPSEPKPE